MNNQTGCEIDYVSEKCAHTYTTKAMLESMQGSLALGNSGYTKLIDPEIQKMHRRVKEGLHMATTLPFDNLTQCQNYQFSS